MLRLVAVLALCLTVVLGNEVHPRQAAPQVEGMRLVGGHNPQTGRLEVLVGGVWGTVCDDLFHETEARVVCRALGLPTGDAASIQMAPFGQGTGPIHLDNVQCRGQEASLNECMFETTSDCSHREDVAVSCVP